MAVLKTDEPAIIYEITPKHIIITLGEEFQPRYGLSPNNFPEPNRH